MSASYTEERKTQLLLIPLPDDTDAYFNSTRFDQTPKTDRKFLDLPVSDQYSARLNLPTDTLNSFSAVWLFGESESAVDRLVKRARGPLVDAFLNGWLPVFDVSESRINRRVSRAQQQSAHRARHEIADLLVASSEFSPQEDIQRLLCDVQTLIGAEKVDYFRPRLHEPKPDGGVSAEWFAGSPEKTARKEPLVITELMVDRLFNQRQPYISTKQSSAIIPVISANHALGLLQFVFRGDQELQNTMPAMIELSCRLGIRVPYRRLLELIKNIMKQMTTTEQVDWQALAGGIAFLFGESACSIWEHNENERKFTRLAIVGSDHALQEIPDDETKQSLIGVCLDRRNTVVVNLEEPGSAAQVLMKDELLKGGFKHGIVAVGEASSNASLSLVVTLWSKTHFRTDHFSSDDQSTLSFLALIMLQMLSVHHLVRAQRDTHDAVLTGLGHELGAPLAAFYDALSLFQPSRRLQDRKSLLEYTQELISGLFIFARIEGLSSRPKETEPRPLIPVKPFEEIIYPIQSVMQFLIQGKGLTLETRFNPSEFPSALQVSEGEDRYLRNIIFNLLNNAMKYSLPTNRPIRIIGKVTARGVEIRVQNFGIGVPAGEKDLIFKREQRGTNAFQAAAVGSGRGLYISRKLAKLLGGDVFLSRQTDPTEFVVQLPFKLAVFQEWKGDGIP